MYLYVINALAWNILSSFEYVGCSNSTVITSQEPYPKYFENDSVVAYFSETQYASSVSLLKDNVTVTTLNETVKNYLFGNLEVRAETGILNPFLCVTWNNLRREDSGTYTCRFNQTISAALSLRVVERPKTALCESGAENRQDYLVGEKLELACYNPFESEYPDIMPKWYANTTQLQGMGDSRLSTATISLRVEENSTIFNCFLTKNDKNIQNRSYSCSVGPIFVYNSSFIHVESYEESSILATESVTINCRIVPRTREASYRWIVEPPQANLVSTSDTDSNLTLTNLVRGTNISLKTRITCIGQLSGQNFTAEYILTVSNPGQIRYEHYILIASSAVLAIIAIVVTVFGCSFTLKKFFKRPVHKRETESSTKNVGTRDGDGVTNTYFSGSGFEEHSDDYMAPRSPNDIKLTNLGPSAHLSNTGCSSNIEQRNQGFLQDELYEDPPDQFPSPFGRYTTTPNERGPATLFDAFGRPIFAPPYHSLPSMNEKQTPMETSPEMIPTWDDELSYEEPFSQSSHHSEEYPPEYESPVEEGLSIDDGINDDLWDYENAGVRK